MSSNLTWYEGKVQYGNNLGRLIGFPTVNLDPSILPATTTEGVYCCSVKYESNIYKGVLYFGPRKVLQERLRVLEIYIISFNKQVYGKIIQFKLLQFIREVKAFASLDSLKLQLRKDIHIINHI